MPSLPFEDADSPTEVPSETTRGKSLAKAPSTDAAPKQVGEGEGNEPEDKGELPNFDEFELEDFPTTEEIEQQQQQQLQLQQQQEEEEVAYYESRARYAEDEEDEGGGGEQAPRGYYEDDEEYQDQGDDGLEYQYPDPPPAANSTNSTANSEWMGLSFF